MAEEIFDLWNPLFLKLSNLLFNLLAPRSQFSYKSQLFFNDSENHIKSSLRTRLEKTFKNVSKTPVIRILLVFFESLENSKTSVKTNRILTFLLLIKIHLENRYHFFALRISVFACDALFLSYVCSGFNKKNASKFTSIYQPRNARHLVWRPICFL